jgi:hypothetical protein
MTFKLLHGGRLLTMGLGVGLAWACAVSDKKDFTFDDSPDSGGRGGASASGGKGGKSGTAGNAGRGAGGNAGRGGSGPLAGEAGEAGQAGQGQGGAEGGSAGTSGKGGTGGLPPCDTGEKRCNGACIDILENDDNCGDCGTACDATHFCQAGTCELDCRSNEEICDGVCINTTSDHDHCGDCETACSSGQVCNMGTCSLDCDNLTNCNGACVDLTNSAQHCGDCDTTCTGNTECVSSMCGCTGGLTLCMPGGAPTCIDTDSDPNNCGDCEVACNLTNAASGCSGGSCTIVSCVNNTADCNRTPGDGCEVDRDTDTANCGVCGMACNLANSVEECVGGVCGIDSCSGTYEDCNNTVGDGCEVDTDSDLGNCGGCNQRCDLANASESCSNGNCTLGSCTGAFRNCNSMPGDGCEVNSNTDPNHCGGCNAVCNLPNANEGCSGGSCTVASCTGTFRNCNSMPADGCEINSANDVNNCGGCNNVCNLPNANEGCSGSSCTVASCVGAFRNCNSMPGDGCEVNSNTDPAHCGGCGNPCGFGMGCVAAVCRERVLLVAAENATYVADVQAKLVGTGNFGAVDIFDAINGTPTAALLNTYSALLVWSDNFFQDPVLLGNRLADYHDAGGRVVVAIFGTTSTYGPTGRWVTGGYPLVVPGAYTSTAQATFTAVDAGSSLLAGVSTFSATTAFRGTGGAAPGAVVVATWADGTPLVLRGAKGGRPRVELNMWPTSSPTYSGAWIGDGTRLMSNALLYKTVVTCHAIVGTSGATCASGAAQFCDAAPIVGTNGWQAQAACTACYGAPCFLATGDCAGPGYGPTAAGQSGSAYFGYTSGCSGVAGRIWPYGSSNTTFGTWAN